MTGIDFVQVGPGHDTLEVHFLKSPALITPSLIGDIDSNKISIAPADGAGSTSETFRIEALEWMPDTTTPLRLRITLDRPGDWSDYILHIDHPKIDPYFSRVRFNFKVACPRDVDCAPGPHECPPDELIDFPVDYQARDFWSLRRALMEFAHQRYPDWEDRGREADLAVMLAEAMSALGDESAYYQDRIAREAYLETASQRRSLRRHARLVDYTVHDGLGACAWLDFTVKDGQSGAIQAGFGVSAVATTGESISFEIGHDLRDILDKSLYPVDSARNSFQPHIWDEDDTCLPVGATELFVKGHHKNVLSQADQIENDQSGIWLALRTHPHDPALPARSWMVWVLEEDVKELTDPVFVNPPFEDPIFQNKITKLIWSADQALPFEMDLTVLEVRGNLLPAVAGKNQKTQYFAIRPPAASCERAETEPGEHEFAIERTGPNGSLAYLFTVPDAENEGLVWLGNDMRSADPEIALFEEVRAAGAGDGSGADAITDREWNWRRSLLGVRSSQPEDRHFTLDDGTWGRVVGYQRIGREIIHTDYRRDGGVTIRFGDGEFGRPPARGTVFRVEYRLGNGASGNLAADSLTSFDPGTEKIYLSSSTNGSPEKAGLLIDSVTNLLPSSGGLDPEIADKVKQMAPFAFQAETFRAVTERDYAEAAERLSWVQRAGARFRWTGSWLSAFVTPDPLNSVQLRYDQRIELQEQLDRFRQTGRETHVMSPKYADLDLEITICVEPTAYRGQAKEKALQRLFGNRNTNSEPGFFSADNFTFGTPLERSALEAAIHDVPQVRAVKAITIARRGWFDERPFAEPAYLVGNDELVRVENDPRHPDRGSARLYMEGGA